MSFEMPRETQPLHQAKAINKDAVSQPSVANPPHAKPAQESDNIKLNRNGDPYHEYDSDIFATIDSKHRTMRPEKGVLKNPPQRTTVLHPRSEDVVVPQKEVTVSKKRNIINQLFGKKKAAEPMTREQQETAQLEAEWETKDWKKLEAEYKRKHRNAR